MTYAGRYVSAFVLFTVIFAVYQNPILVQTMRRNDDSRSLAPFVFIGVLLLGGGFLTYINYKTNEPFSLSRRTSLPADAIIERLVGRYTVRGWTTPSQTDRGATFHRRSGPSIIITLLLFLLGIVPGILYLLLGGRSLTLSVTTRILNGGITEVEVIGNGRSDGSMRIAAEVLVTLP